MSGVVQSGVFFIVWFLALFILLPIGIRDEGEPTLSLRSKFILATLIALIGWGLFYALIYFGVLDIGMMREAAP